MEQLINLQTLLIQSVNIAIVIFVLARFVFRPYMKYLDEEAKKRKLYEEQISKSENILNDAHHQAQNVIDQARLDAKLMANEIKELARKEADEIVVRAQKDADTIRTKSFVELDVERKNMESEMKKRVLDVALKLNAKFFGKSDAHETFLKESAKEVQF